MERIIWDSVRSTLLHACKHQRPLNERPLVFTNALLGIPIVRFGTPNNPFNPLKSVQSAVLCLVFKPGWYALRVLHRNFLLQLPDTITGVGVCA